MKAKSLPPYLTPVNILDADANDQLKKYGELARQMELRLFNMICLEHGPFAYGIREDRLAIEETRHRIGEGCWHKISKEG